MKKLLINLFFVGLVSAITAQTSNDINCIYCKENIIGNFASAIGTKNEVTGQYSLATGFSNIVKGDYSLASGESNTINGNYSGAFGKNANTSGQSSFALGQDVQALGDYNIAIGKSNLSNGILSHAYGNQVTSSEIGSISLGNFLQNKGTYSLVIGSGISSSTKLFSDTDYSLAIGFKSTEPTFFVSQSQSSTKTGRIGIGNITDPSYKLHIKADDNEDAAIFLQPTGSNYYGKIFFGDESHSISAKTGEALTFFTETGQNFAFEAGNILQTTGFNLTTSQIKAPDANGLKLTDMNGNGIFVDDGGNVGIGSETFESKLTVENGNGTWLSLKTTNSESGSWYFNNTGTNQYGLGLVYSYNGPGMGGSDNIPIMSFNKNGNVGIGDNTPDQKLELSGGGIQLNGEYGIGFNGDIPFDGEAWDDKAKIYFDEDFGGDWQDYLVIEKTDNNTTTDGGIAFTTKGIDNVRKSLMTIKGNGNVGIGNIQTSNIDSKLMVDGKIKATQLQITDGTTNTNGLVLMSDANGLASWSDPSAFSDQDWLTNDDGKIYHTNSYVGIGTSDPKAKLEIYGNMIVGSSAKKFIFHSNWTTGKLIIAPVNNEGAGEWSNAITLFENGNFGIGFTEESYALAKLTVKGNIRAREVKVRLNAGGADFVFADDYTLPALKETEEYITNHKHLPNIPSAKEMEEEGIDLGDMQMKLLQKVEELTLYVIELKKENEVMKGKIEKIKED